jgi:hypothetical protein
VSADTVVQLAGEIVLGKAGSDRGSETLAVDGSKSAR